MSIHEPPLEGRVIPAGETLPAVYEPAELPPHPPGPDDLPPWRRPRAAEPAPADDEGEETEPELDEPRAPRRPRTIPAEPPPDVLVVTVRVPDDGANLHPVDAAPSLWDRLRLPWCTLAGAALALLPIPFTGYSAAATWQSTVWYAHEQAIPAGYGLAAVGILAAYRAERRSTNAGPLHAVLVRAWTITALIGTTGALDLWDPIQILTGVNR